MAWASENQHRLMQNHIGDLIFHSATTKWLLKDGSEIFFSLI